MKCGFGQHEMLTNYGGLRYGVKVGCPWQGNYDDFQRRLLTN